MQTSTPPFYEFGEFRIDAAKRRLLRRDGSLVPLTPRVFDTLLYLVEHNGAVIERNRLLDAVWPDAVVEENNITQNISTLRRVLGEAAGSNLFIVTVPGRGYRFVAEVRAGEYAEGFATNGAQAQREPTNHERIVPSVPADQPHRRRNFWIVSLAMAGIVGLALAALYFWSARQSPSQRPSAETPVSLPISSRSIAVLPFANLSRDTENAYFADGIKDEILARLSKVAALKVISRTSTEKYKNAPVNLREMALQLGVAHILEGSVQRSGEMVRVTVQLIHAETDAHLWAETYDRQLTDMFEVETEIAQRIVTALEATLSGSESYALTTRPTANAEAHEAYLKGRYFWNKRTVEGFKQAVQYLTRAVELDPGYAQAYAGLADALLFLGGENGPEQKEMHAKGMAALRKAIELDETLAEPHASLGLLAMNFEGDWGKAEQELKRAIELNPNYATAHQWYGEFLADMGRPEEGIREINRARELDPLSVIINSDVAKVYLLTRRYDEAVKQFRHTLELDPDFGQAHGLLGLTYSLQGLHDKALEQSRKARGWENDARALGWLGWIYGASGNKTEAEKVLSRLRDLSNQTYVSPLWVINVYVGMGDKDQAFAWFEKIFEEGPAGGATVLKANPIYDNLRTDPRFADLLRRAKLTP
jgi:TolB-like protein/DNA-binding winged helix-turn-helix (wHTH) protein/cytochrome c-type biogenesis protein CcmH/NrfG